MLRDILILLIGLYAAGFFIAGDVRAFQLPAWVMKLTAEKQMAEVDNPPGYIEKCAYQGREVFYVSSACCDQYSYLYDANQAVVCAPDGGKTGKGDGKCPDYYAEKTDCVTIWEDRRTLPPAD